MEETKKCTKCSKEKPLGDFHTYSKSKDGKYTQCKECAYKANKQTYFRTSGKRNKYIIERRRKIANKRLEYLISLNLKCERCGFDHIAALDFHHLVPENKKYVISNLRWSGCSEKTFREEIKKCIVLCSNCHRIEHWNEKNKL